MQKYKILKDDFKIVYGKKLYRIKALKDFGNIKKDNIGGYIEKESNLSQDNNCWVYGNARVYGNAHVSDYAHVSGNARVYGNAHVSGNTRVSGNARVYGNADVSGNTRVSGNAYVYGNARVYGNAECKKSPINIIGLKYYNITITDNLIRIGCYNFNLEKWLSLKKADLDKLDVNAYDFSRKYKTIIKKLAEIHQNDF